MNLSKRLLLLAAAFSITGAVNCAALGLRQNKEISIQKIIEQWVVIERGFIDNQFLNSKNMGGDTEFLSEKIDAFADSLEAFLNSETYRIFRLAPLSPNATTVLGPSAPNEIPEIRAAFDLVKKFRDAI